MQKTLTISIAAYNVEKYIRKALDSLIDEEIIDDLEIFVVDDGGTDGTLRIAQEYAEKYPQSIFPVHKENGGYGSTINSSINMATGKYFKQLDGDDWFKTDNLRAFVALLKEVDVDCMLTDYSRYYEAKGEERIPPYYNNIEDGKYEIEKSGLNEQFRMYNVTFATELLKNMEERLTEHCFYTDAEFASYPVPYIKTVYIYHQMIYIYRIGQEGQSVSKAGIEKHHQEEEIVFWNLLNTYKKINPENNVKRKIVFDSVQLRLVDRFRFLCLLPFSKEAWNMMREFEKKVQAECPEILAAAEKQSKAIRLLVESRFSLYPIIRIWVGYKWLK